MTPRRLRIVYASSAVDDLIRLRAFIATHNPSAARRIGAELVRRIDALRTAPRMGRKVDAAPDPEVVRDMVFDPYIVRYAITARSIAVLRVWHHLEQRS